MRADVIIVGGGPAGAVLAWKLSRKLSVLVIDKRHLLQDDRIHAEEKCCGGMLDHSAQKELAHLGLPLPQRIVMDPQIFTVRAIDFDGRMERYYQRNYMNIDRAEFDSWLLKLAAARKNVKVLEGASAYSFEASSEEVIVKVRLEDGSQEEIHGSFLVGADGASSAVKKYVVKRWNPRFREPKVYASIQEWHPVKEPLPYYGAMFDRQVTDYYSWIIPKTVKEGGVLPAGNYFLMGSAIPADSRETAGASVRERFERMRWDMTSRGFDVDHPAKTSGAMILRPHMFGSILTGRERVFLCGEAAGLISPSSSEGISFAMRSGEALARSFKNVSPSDAEAPAAVRKKYEKNLAPLKLSIAIKCLKSPIMYGKLPRGLVFRSRALSMKVLKKTERWN